VILFTAGTVSKQKSLSYRVWLENHLLIRSEFSLWCINHYNFKQDGSDIMT
jgi:hypothetical protein